MVRKYSKGQIDVLPLLIAAILVGLIVVVGFYSNTTKKLEGKCQADAFETLGKIQQVIDKIKNPSDRATFPVKLGDCVSSLIFANRDEMFGVFKTANVDINHVFNCPDNFRGLIAIIPFEDQSKSPGALGTFDSVSQGLKNKDLKKLLNWGTSAVGINLKAECKNLPGANQYFEESKVLPGSKSGETIYCLEILMVSQNSFKIIGNDAVEKEADCKTNVGSLPIV